jgi:pantetheine-phosphate adenylyltransferase
MGYDDEATIGSVLAIAAGLLVLSWTLILAPHVYRIAKPSIVAYPWDDDDSIKQRKSNDGDSKTTKQSSTTTVIGRTVIFAASYNPPHNGHLRILKYLSGKYEKVIAVVGFNPDKKYLVSPEDRACLLREMLKSRTENVTVEVVEGYIWRYAKRIGATRFFRGIRSWEKDGSDERVLQILNTWGPLLYGPLAIPIPTIYIEGDPRYNHVSSTLIRTICRSKRGYSGDEDDDDEQAKIIEGPLAELVPSEVAGKVAKLYGGKQ